MIRFAPLLLLLCACPRGVPDGSPDRKALDAVEDAWHDAGLPDLDDCLDDVTVARHKTKSTYVHACSNLHPGLFGEQAAASHACLLNKPNVTEIHIAPDYHANLSLVQHEGLHAAYRCAYGHTDRWHLDARVWVDREQPDSVESRANAAL